ncbi:MAG: DUF3656 domain-containing protein [Eubacteriales bacterium]|nr:DUF3656 domain-containing protein [Eubacteriales bacterium]
MDDHIEQIPELLSPAGGPEQLRAAVENGADAVYLGGRLHNARQNAANFDDDTLRAALAYAHVRGVAVHVTLNTLITQNELPEALEYAASLYAMGADALIVQDLGLARELRRLMPDFPLHLSTQATVCDASYARLAARRGFSRVVLARETEWEDICRIVKEAPIEVEVFAHGAMCVCFSGQCLFSSMIGGRSGNRGACAQPCRLPYTLLKDGQSQASGYLLSPKDNCTAEHLALLCRAGVASLKLEGRMKSAEYVAAVTHVYRKYLDAPGDVDAADRKLLLQAFNRGGFAPGYLRGWSARDFICRERPKHWGVLIGTVLDSDERRSLVQVQLSDDLALGDGVELDCEGFPGNVVTAIFRDNVPQAAAHAGDLVWLGSISQVKLPAQLYKTSDKAQGEWARRSYAPFTRRVTLRGEFSVSLGQPARLRLYDEQGHTAVQEGTRPAETAIRRELRDEEVFTQLKKTGNTPFVLEECALSLPAGLSLPVSELNSLRRGALEQMEQLRANRYPQRTAPAVDVPSAPTPEPADAGLSAFFYHVNADALAAAGQARRICVPLSRVLSARGREAVSPCAARGQQVLFWLPPETIPAQMEDLRRQAAALKAAGFTGALAGNPGQLETLRELGFPVWGDMGWNVFNTSTALEMADLGLKGLTLSPELTMRQIQSVAHPAMEAEAIVYGRLPLMYSKHCPVGAEMGGGAHCGLCHTGRFALRDRKDMQFPLICFSGVCRCVILNAVRLHVPDFAARLADAGVSTLRLIFTEETPQEIAEVLASYTQALRDPPEHFLRGESYTAGHYLRGV